jgi:hypothetical protein
MRTRLILSQYREGSDYQDRVGHQYHFPRKYYSHLTLPDIEFIYYEPKRSGKGEYFGYGRVGKITQDVEEPGQFYAEILDYHPFQTPVPYKAEDGTNLEEDLGKLAQLAVRPIDPECFNDICASGGLDLAAIGSEPENVESDELIRNPFDPSSIKIDREAQTIFQVTRKIGFDEIELNPDFQRNVVWDVVRRSRLIESILLKIPLPAFYFDGTKDSKWVVVDGLQRLTSLKEFMLTKSLRLQDMEYLPDLEGKSFDELPRILQRQIEDTQLTIYVIRPDTPPEVKFTIFYRINTGGLVLTAQEIRNALFNGPATALLKKLAALPIFHSATGYSLSDSRMDAQECILRYLAFNIRSYQEYRPDLNVYLSTCMRDINMMPQDKVDQLADRFTEAMNRAQNVLGRFAFRKFNLYTARRGPLNKALFESWANVLQNYPNDELIAKKEVLLQALGNELETNAEYGRYLSAGTGGTKAVHERFRIAARIVEDALR